MRVATPGGNRLPHVGELFTDRESESQAFATALACFRRLLDADEDAGVARHNVLTYYGLGGIGKTALSERLEAWARRDLPLVNGWGPPPPTRVDATARIDLHSSAGQMDLPATLLALRAGVAGLRPRWPVFDLAFAAYWSAIRPGEPLPVFRGGEDYNETVAQTTGEVLKDIGSAVDATGAGTAVGLGLWGVRKLVTTLRRRRDLRLGIESYPDFELFLLRCAEEPSPTEARPDLACAIAGILAWELSAVTPCPLLTVFVDTTERLALDPRRVSESHLNRLVHDMPNVLFVLTGRDMLNWHSTRRIELEHRGPWTWPGLVPGSPEEPRQHLVGGLSPSDARALIHRGRRMLDLPMSDEVVEELVRSSAGLPQYLELARQVAITIKNAGDGRTVQAADVTGSLGSLVMRVLDDVPPDEQRAIRAACLFRVFDTTLMAAAADVDHGCAERAVNRPMIDRHEGDRFPYRMHDAVREAIRTADHQVTGGWSEQDWELAATRGAATARELHDAAKSAEDIRGVLDAVGLAVGLVCDQHTDLGPAPSSSYEDWLSRAIVFSPSVQGLRSRVPSVSRTGYGRLVLTFITAKSVETPLAERLDMLREIYRSDHPLRWVAGRHLGYTLRNLERFDDALATFDELSRRRPVEVNLGQRGHVLTTARRFVEAREAAIGRANQKMIGRMAAYVHGRPERYFSEVGERLRGMRDSGRQREYLEDLTLLLHRRVFFHGDAGPDEIGELLDEAELSGNSLALRSVLVAQVLARASAPGEVAAALDRIRTLDQAAGPAGTIGFRYAFAEFCDAVVTGDRERLVRLRAEASELPFRVQTWIPVECLLTAVGLPLDPVPTQWLEPPETVVTRWTDHLHTYLSRHGATLG